MSRYYGGWAPYVPVAARRATAEREMEKLRKKGTVVSPVKLESNKIAATFWGKAWCDNLESYHDYENRLPRGRTYVRNGSVVDLQIAAREVTALVSGSSIYKVKITIGEVAKSHWTSICTDCSGAIDSLVELLQGRFSKGVMERICRQGTGLFPKPSEIKFSCSCPDYASMCKHVAATLYGVGARLDAKPELLFRLRAVNENDLVADIGTMLPMAGKGPAAGKVLEADDMAALFGLDMGDAAEPNAVAPVKTKALAASRKKAGPGLKAVTAQAATPKVVTSKKTVTPKVITSNKAVTPKVVTLRKAVTPKVVTLRKAVTPKAGAPAAKIARAGAMQSAPKPAEPKPVEWWKPGALKEAGKTRVASRVTTTSGTGRKVRAIA